MKLCCRIPNLYVDTVEEEWPWPYPSWSKTVSVTRCINCGWCHTITFEQTKGRPMKVTEEIAA